MPSGTAPDGVNIKMVDATPTTTRQGAGPQRLTATSDYRKFSLRIGDRGPGAIDISRQWHSTAAPQPMIGRVQVVQAVQIVQAVEQPGDRFEHLERFDLFERRVFRASFVVNPKIYV